MSTRQRSTGVGRNEADSERVGRGWLRIAFRGFSGGRTDSPSRERIMNRLFIFLKCEIIKDGGSSVKNFDLFFYGPSPSVRFFRCRANFRPVHCERPLCLSTRFFVAPRCPFRSVLTIGTLTFVHSNATICCYFNRRSRSQRLKCFYNSLESIMVISFAKSVFILLKEFAALAITLNSYEKLFQAM